MIKIKTSKKSPKARILNSGILWWKLRYAWLEEVISPLSTFFCIASVTDHEVVLFELDTEG